MLRRVILSVVVAITLVAPVAVVGAEEDTVMAFPEKRRYWQGCNEEALQTLLKPGIPQIQARLLCSGEEFVPFESIRKGFRFAINEEHTAFVTVPGWLPDKNTVYDFFCTPDLVLVAEYDSENKVRLVTRLPKKEPS